MREPNITEIGVKKAGRSVPLAFSPAIAFGARQNQIPLRDPAALALPNTSIITVIPVVMLE
jgi:hypothetical protein